MNRQPFYNMIFATQILANQNLDEMSREDALTYLRAINACLRSLIDINCRDMMEYQTPPAPLNPLPVQDVEDPNNDVDAMEEDPNVELDVDAMEEDPNVELDVDAMEEDPNNDVDAISAFNLHSYDDSMEIDNNYQENYTIPEEQRWPLDVYEVRRRGRR